MKGIRHITLLIAFAIGLMAASAQDKIAVLTGRVIDADDGYPLIGVTVMVQGTQYGAVTDVDGNYELRIPSKECEIVFSYVG